MRSGQRTKLMAGAGLATMLLGALMVVAPGGAGAVVVGPNDPRLENGGNLLCSSLDASFVYEAVDNTQEGDVSGSVDENGIKVTWSLDTKGTEIVDDDVVTFTVLAGSLDVSGVVVKAGNAGNEASGGITVYEIFDPAVSAPNSGSVGYPSNKQISNVRFCAADDLPSLTVTKKVATDDEFDITVSQEETKFSETKRLGNDESIVVEDADGTYVISEALPEGWEDPAFECGQAEWSDVEGVFTVEVDGADVTCTVTNTPHEQEQRPKVVVEKQVVNRADWAFEFEICQDAPVLTAGEAQALAVAQDCEEFELTDEAPSKEFYRGGNVRITELEGTPANWTLTDITCDPENESDLETATAWVQIGETPVTTCTFTNTYPGTPPPVVTTPTTTPEPASLTVVKDVTGDSPDEWEFTFRLGGDDNELFTLDEGTDQQTFELPAGEYSVREFDLPNDRSTLIGIECLDGDDEVGDEDGDTVSLTLAAGDDVTCTFTNDFVEVQPSEVTVPPTTAKPTPSSTVPPTTAKPTTAKPTPQVLGAQTTRTLPRTGNETRDLAGLGAALIGLGAALLVGSRRREDFVS